MQNFSPRCRVQGSCSENASVPFLHDCRAHILEVFPMLRVHAVACVGARSTTECLRPSIVSPDLHEPWLSFLKAQGQAHCWIRDDIPLVHQVAVAPEQALQSSAPDALNAKCPSDVQAILSWIKGSMDASDPNHLLERLLSGQEKCRKALATELFPGRVWWGSGCACLQPLR